MEDDLKILQVEYLSNYWSYCPQYFNLLLGDQAKKKSDWNEGDLQRKH
jgi:hypothetical protein